MPSPQEEFDAEMKMLSGQFPQAQIPPMCYQWMQVNVVDYESRIMLKTEISVTEAMLNPMRVMQGGFIVAAFDNAFGPLSYAAARRPCTTLDMHTQYIRPIPAGEKLVVVVRVVSRGPVSLHLAGEAYNGKGKQIAACSTNMIVMK